MPEAATWYLETTLPRPEASLAEIVRRYALRNWVEQAYKQVKQSLGWSHSQVRSDVAMRRHWALVQCAFAFCWWAECRTPRREAAPATEAVATGEETASQRGGKGGRFCVAPALAVLAAGAAAGAGLAGAGPDPVALLDGVDRPASPTATTDALGLAAAGAPTPPL